MAAHNIPHISLSRSFRADRSIHDLYDLAHVAGWEPYNLHDLAHLSWVGSVLYTDPDPYDLYDLYDLAHVAV